MTTTAKLNNQFDYITLRIKFNDGEKLNLTKSRNGTKISGTQRCATRSALEFLDRFISGQAKNGKNYGQVMQYLCDKAQTSSTVQEFLASV